VFILNSIDKYLKDKTFCGVILPDTLLNGYHHEPFRKQEYIRSDWPVDFKISEIWELPTDTFKNKAIVVFGQKTDADNPDTIMGRRIFSDRDDEPLNFRVLRQGRRTAWSSNAKANSITDGVLDKIPFLQGADIMPRTLVFHKAIRQPNGKWSLLPIPRKNDELSYLVSGAKEHKEFSINVQNVDDQFMFEFYQSNHLLPFIVCDPAMAFLPMKRDNEIFIAVDEAEIASYGSATSAAFARIFAEAGESAVEYFNRINMRNKLNPQKFNNLSDEAQLVFVGAGGGYTCAAYIPVTQINREKTIIDQTLYWHIALSEDEALYICALLNSRALDEIIADFQPVGAMGRRHVHKLPYAVTPPFNPDNEAHILVVEKARALKDKLYNDMNDSQLAQYIPPSRSTLQVRRSKVREFIHGLQESADYEDACKGVYDV
jgi:hypothetical protein